MTNRRSTPCFASLIAMLVGVTGCSREVAQVATTELQPTPDTVIAAYSEVTGAAWLGGDRWAVIAPLERAVGVVNFDRKTLGRFGGSRPGELQQPFHLFRSGDSIYIADWLRRRITRWSLAGSLEGSIPAPERFRGTLPKARDAAGRWYLELRPAPGRDGQGNLDSAAIVRASPDFAEADTVVRLAPFDLAEVQTEAGRRFERRLLSGEDQWDVLPDGTVWIARVTQNRVDWRDPAGRQVRGNELPDRVLPVTQNDRDVFLHRFEPGLRPTVEQIPFAAIKPPFVGALTDPTGRVWVVKNRAIGDSLRTYQIVDRSGKLVRLVSHPGLGRILGLGNGRALVGEPFANGVRLLLFRVPGDSSSAGT
ncbi:MAG TPA: hypothetical protein VH879_16970 [Gemmatimonadales bacterium]|jgi:hypothetical protein